MGTGQWKVYGNIKRPSSEMLKDVSSVLEISVQNSKEIKIKAADVWRPEVMAHTVLNGPFSNCTLNLMKEDRFS